MPSMYDTWCCYLCFSRIPTYMHHVLNIISINYKWREEHVFLYVIVSVYNIDSVAELSFDDFNTLFQLCDFQSKHNIYSVLGVFSKFKFAYVLRFLPTLHNAQWRKYEQITWEYITLLSYAKQNDCIRARKIA